MTWPDAAPFTVVHKGLYSARHCSQYVLLLLLVEAGGSNSTVNRPSPGRTRKFCTFHSSRSHRRCRSGGST